jgi:hypothetical protein
VERCGIAGMGGKWWGPPGLRFGCEVLDLDWLEPAEKLGDNAILVSGDTKATDGRGKGHALHDAVIAADTGWPVAMLGLRNGAPGVRDGVAALVDHLEADLVVLVDIGAHSFFTGTETTVMSPLITSLSVQAVHALDVPSAFAVTAYACDAEMPVAMLHERVALAMQHGGFLGAHGLTPQDAADLERLLSHVPLSDIETRPYRAARGELGPTIIKRFWSTEVLPLAAIYLFFAIDVLVDKVNPLPSAIAATTTLEEAEQVVLDAGVFPETRLPFMIDAPTPPQVPDT